MARLTVEDCLEHVNNRFDLIIKASKRARQLAMGAEPGVEWDNDKPSVVALREIASGMTDLAEKEERAQAEARAAEEFAREQQRNRPMEDSSPLGQE